MKKKCKCALVTGGAGFIGSRISERLLKEGWRVFVADNLSTGSIGNIPSGVEFIEADIRSKASLEKLPFQEFSAILHLAAQSSGPRSAEIADYDLETNILGTLFLLQLCSAHRVKRFIYASSMAAYGDQKAESVTEDSPLNPLSFYGISKKSAEEYVSYFHRHGLDTTVFRMFSVYGPGQDLMNMQQGMLSIYLKFVIDGLPICVTGSRDRFRDFIFIDDVADAWVSVLNLPVAYGRTYNLGTGVKTHVWEIITTILAVMGKNGNYPVEYGKTGKDDQMGLVANIDRIYNDLKWRPKWSLSNGLTEMIRWADFAGKNTGKSQ